MWCRIAHLVMLSCIALCTLSVIDVVAWLAIILDGCDKLDLT